MVILTKNTGLKHSVASHPCERTAMLHGKPTTDCSHRPFPFFKLQTVSFCKLSLPSRGPVPGTGLERGSLQTPRSSRLGLAANFEGVSVNTIYIPMLTPFLTPCSCFLLESHFSSCLYCKNSSTKRLYDKIYHYVLFNPTNPLKKFIMLL